MDIIEKLTWILDEIKNGQYGVQEIPIYLTEIDEQISIIIELYKTMKSDEKEKLLMSITEDTAWPLLCYAIRMATYSLRFSSQECFTNGLYAIGMTLGKIDIKELLTIMPLYCDVQKRNNLSFAELLRQKNDFSIFLTNFINRDEKDRTLECMGFVLISDDNNNPIYKRTW